MTALGELSAYVPTPPGFVIDWAALEARFDWLRAMRGCDQSPLFHAEGDVLEHTRRVVEWLVSSPAFREELGPDERAAAFAAALLHDVGKPLRTAHEPDGRITAKGHAAAGEVMVRRILWELGASIVARELVAHMVRFHELPFFLVEDADPVVRAVYASQVVDPALLALVAEADARGRQCRDLGRLLDAIELFEAQCEELGCFEAPFAFAGAHARFDYFWRVRRDPRRDPRYAPHEATRGEVVVLSGLPGAGKDAWVAARLGDRPVISLDALRVELDAPHTGNQGAVIAAAREQARAHLRAGRPFVWNATNLSRRLRRQVTELAASYGARIEIVYLEASPDELRRRNAARPEPLPDAAREKMLRRWQTPDVTEAHAVTWNGQPAGYRPAPGAGGRDAPRSDESAART
jgi:putative nucleotidyltransferase with HDIG domain